MARLRAAGAVILGKTTLPEFGWKGITDSRLHGDATRNPWNPARSPGGSSGGAAAALAAGIGTLAFGNDGGGSIRIPASFCGLYGLKPTAGRVPHHPMEGAVRNPGRRRPRSPGACRTRRRMLAVMAQPDDRDWYALPAPAPDWLADLRPRLTGLRIGYAPDLGGVTGGGGGPAEARPGRRDAAGGGCGDRGTRPGHRAAGKRVRPVLDRRVRPPAARDPPRAVG